MTSIDPATFVKSLLGVMWMLNDLPRAMRRDIDAQMGLVWLLVSDPQCFPSITFSQEQAKAICDALEDCGPPTKKCRYTYEDLVSNASKLKLPLAMTSPSPNDQNMNDKHKEDLDLDNFTTTSSQTPYEDEHRKESKAPVQG